MKFDLSWVDVWIIGSVPQLAGLCSLCPKHKVTNHCLHKDAKTPSSHSDSGPWGDPLWGTVTVTLRFLDLSGPTPLTHHIHRARSPPSPFLLQKTLWAQAEELVQVGWPTHISEGIVPKWPGGIKRIGEGPSRVGRGRQTPSLVSVFFPLPVAPWTNAKAAKSCDEC